MNIAYIEKPTFRGGTEILICHTQTGSQEAHLATELLRHLAIVAGTPDKEDSAGRQQLRLLSPDEVAKRACDITACAFAEFAERGWLLAIPLPKSEKTSKEEL